MPLTPLLVLINQLINMRLHAFKICRSRRRPLAQKTGGVSEEANGYIYINRFRHYSHI